MATDPAPDRQWAIQRLQLNGIPVFVAPSAGNLHHACLTFRVGLTDEPMSRRGITHLIEHLVLKGLGEKPYRYNGMVDGLFARFYMSGRAGDVVGFFNHVSTALRTLPTDRLVQESEVLRTEAANRPIGWLPAMLAYRYGYQGWGLLAAEELGLHHPTVDELERWLDTCFTSANVILWMSGSIPAGLNVEFGPGKRMPPASSSSVLAGVPAWVAQKAGGVGITMTGTRSTELRLMVHVAQRRAQSELRGSGLSYSVQLSYDPQSKDRAHLGLWADALPANVTKAGRALLEVVDELMERGPRQEELDQYIGEMERTHDEPEAVLGWLATTASNELLGAPPMDRDEWFTELRAVTPQTARQALVDAMRTMLVMAPPEVTPPPARFTPVSHWSDQSVTGVASGLRLGLSTVGRNIRLTLADDGVTLAFDRRRIMTVWFERCAAMLVWNDGSRTLFGHDGFRLHLCPRDWRDGAGIIQWLDQHVGNDRVVAMGDRPKPDPQALIHEPAYRLKTEYLTALVGGIWGALLLDIVVSVMNSMPSGLVPMIVLGIAGTRLTMDLYFRLRAPRVRQV